jgi:hypothetical protein
LHLNSSYDGGRRDSRVVLEVGGVALVTVRQCGEEAASLMRRLQVAIDKELSYIP